MTEPIESITLPPPQDPQQEGEWLQASLQQWLDIEARRVDGEIGPVLRDDAIEWFEAEVRRIRGLENAVEAWLDLNRLAAAPYSRLVDDDARARAREVLDEVRGDSRVAVEEKIQGRYRGILRDEIVDLTVERLANCSKAYRALWTKYPDFHYGELARRSYERTQELLGTVPAAANE